MNLKCKTIVIAAGGAGKRLKNYFTEVNYSGTKVLYPINNKPLLQHVIETAFAAGMERIFVLTKYDAEAVTSFLHDKYSTDERLVILSGLQDTTISSELLALEEKLTEPFVYTDGNILYSPSLLKSLISQPYESLATITISKKDYAPTHLNVLIDNDGNISNICTRLVRGETLQNRDAHQYCSLGVMCFNPNIFTLMKQHKDIYDLDYLIEHLYNNAELKNSLSYFIYDDEWSGLHVAEDVKKMEEYVKTCL